MKTLTTLIVAICIAVPTFAQSALKTVKQQVSNPAILENWKLGEVKVFDDVSIVRLEGENGIEHRTNVFYTSGQNIQQLVASKASEQNLSEEEKAALMQSFLDDAPGGQLSLFFDREEKRLADPRLFTIEVVDAYSGELIFRKALEYEEPQYYKWGIWYFHKTINIPYHLEREFVVNVFDEGLNETFKFRVTVRPDDNSPIQKEFILSKAVTR